MWDRGLLVNILRCERFKPERIMEVAHSHGGTPIISCKLIKKLYIGRKVKRFVTKVIR